MDPAGTPRVQDGENFHDLRTIPDFDMGVGDALSEFVRVGKVPETTDVKKDEMNILLWLILENQIQRMEDDAIRKALDLVTTLGKIPEHDDAINVHEDVVDAGGGDVRDAIVFLSERTRRRTGSNSGKVRKHVEQLLRHSGISLPFNRLTVADKKSLFQQFNTGTKLFPSESFSSVSDLFEALRSRSKLLEEFHVEERVGGGLYGDVYSVIHKQDRKRYAAKRISLSMNCFEEMKMTLNESKLLQGLQHENIIRCYEAWMELKPDEEEPLKFYILMDFCSQTLEEWMEERRITPTTGQMTLVIRDTLNGLQYLHSKNILHFDIRPANLMWADEARTLVKITDFGLALHGQFYPYPTGSVPYAAPDLIFTCKSDVYSMGVTYLQIARNIITMTELSQVLRSKDYNTAFPFLNNTLVHILSTSPNTRPTAGDVRRMLNRVLNPPPRVDPELRPEDYALVGHQLLNRSPTPPQDENPNGNNNGNQN